MTKKYLFNFNKIFPFSNIVQVQTLSNHVKVTGL